jgi:hypothetical protein
MSEKITLQLDMLVVDPVIQTRALGINQKVVEEYAALMRKGTQFPPLDVFYDGTLYVLADGFHREAAARMANQVWIDVNVHEGDRRAALLFAMRANSTHGLRRTSKDKRHAVEMLLKDPEWGLRSNVWIAEAAGVDQSSVATRRHKLGLASGKTLGRDGIFRSVKQKDNKGTTKRRVERMTRTEEAVKELASSREEKILKLAHMTADGKMTVIQACNELGAPPREVLLLAEEAERKGSPIHFATARDERNEHLQKAKIRDLLAAKHKLLDELKSRDAQIDILSALRAAAPCEPIVARNGIGEGKRRQATPVMLLSDWHIEESVRPETINNMNEYTPEIAEKCIERCAEAWEWFARDTRWDMREGVIWLGGDLESGYIHEELVESNFMSPTEAIVWLQDRIEKMFRTILANTNFERIIVPCNSGNHGRLTFKIRIATRESNSIEWLLYKTLAARFADEPRLQFQIAEGHYNYLNVYDRTLAFTHGDTFRYQGGVGGLLIPVRRGLNEIRKYKPVSYISMGHFHQRMDTGDIATNGSMIGINNYAIANNFSPEPRQQSWFLIDHSRGKCLTAPIWLPQYEGNHV